MYKIETIFQKICRSALQSHLGQRNFGEEAFGCHFIVSLVFIDRSTVVVPESSTKPGTQEMLSTDTDVGRTIGVQSV